MEQNLFKSGNVLCHYLQMRDDLHLFLLDKGLIEDEIKILDVDYTFEYWDRGVKGEKCLVKCSGDLFFTIDCEEFDAFVNNGYELS